MATNLHNDCDFRFYENVIVPDTNDPLVSFRMKYVRVHGYISTIICVCGVILNAANIVVLTRKNMISSINVLLTWLAVTDNLKMLDYLIFAIEVYILKDPQLDYLHSFSRKKAKYIEFHASFALVCHNIGIWLTVALATFRFLYIWFPTKGKALCTVMRAKLTVGLIYFTIAVICIPNYCTNYLERKDIDQEKAPNMTCPPIYSVEMISQKNVIFTINTYIQAIFSKLIPCVLLTVLTFSLIYAMHQAYKKRKLLLSQGHDLDARRHHEHNRTTGMLLAVVILFLLVELPQGIMTLMIVFFPAEWMDRVYDNIGDLHELFALCNNAINFVLYCTMSKQFRKTFFSIFCSCLPKQNYRIINLADRNHFTGSMNHNHTRHCAEESRLTRHHD